MALSGLAAFDGATGGFNDGKIYLLHGPLGAGKTTWALQFLVQGLRAGERGALVVRRSAPVVLDQARAFGFNLDEFVADGRLALLEYAPRVVENAARLKSDDEIFEEFCSLLSARVKRVVLDPVTPLLSSASSAMVTFRARALANSFAQLGATTLYLCDSPEADAVLPGLRDVVYGTLRLEPAAVLGRGRLVAEQIPGIRLDPIEYELKSSLGLVAAAPVATAGTPAGQRTVLVLMPRQHERERIAGALAAEHEVHWAEDAADGLARMAAAAPDLVVVDEHAGSLDGADFCRKLRASGVNVPIILVADRLRRARDRVALLESGADECLDRPVDPRLLRLKCRALLGRYDPGANRLTEPRPAIAEAASEHDGVSFTTDFAYFMARAHGECQTARGHGLSFGLVAVQPATRDDFACLCTRLQEVVREYDLVWAGDVMAFVLLAETEERGLDAFLARLAQASAPDDRPRCARLLLPAAEASREAVDAFVEANLSRPPVRSPLAVGE